jgi:hypothetical protein
VAYVRIICTLAVVPARKMSNLALLPGPLSPAAFTSKVSISPAANGHVMVHEYVPLMAWSARTTSMPTKSGSNCSMTAATCAPETS